jgi:hypothetical protein
MLHVRRGQRPGTGLHCQCTTLAPVSKVECELSPLVWLSGRCLQVAQDDVEGSSNRLAMGSNFFSGTLSWGPTMWVRIEQATQLQSPGFSTSLSVLSSDLSPICGLHYICIFQLCREIVILLAQILPEPRRSRIRAIAKRLLSPQNFNAEDIHRRWCLEPFLKSRLSILHIVLATCMTHRGTSPA